VTPCVRVYIEMLIVAQPFKKILFISWTFRDSSTCHSSTV